MKKWFRKILDRIAGRLGYVRGRTIIGGSDPWRLHEWFDPVERLHFYRIDVVVSDRELLDAVFPEGLVIAKFEAALRAAREQAAAPNAGRGSGFAVSR